MPPGRIFTWYKMKWHWGLFWLNSGCFSRKLKVCLRSCRSLSSWGSRLLPAGSETEGACDLTWSETLLPVWPSHSEQWIWWDRTSHISCLICKRIIKCCCPVVCCVFVYRIFSSLCVFRFQTGARFSRMEVFLLLLFLLWFSSGYGCGQADSLAQTVSHQPLLHRLPSVWWPATARGGGGGARERSCWHQPAQYQDVTVMSSVH